MTSTTSIFIAVVMLHCSFVICSLTGSDMGPDMGMWSDKIYSLVPKVQVSATSNDTTQTSNDTTVTNGTDNQAEVHAISESVDQQNSTEPSTVPTLIEGVKGEDLLLEGGRSEETIIVNDSPAFGPLGPAIVQVQHHDIQEHDRQDMMQQGLARGTIIEPGNRRLGGGNVTPNATTEASEDNTNIGVQRMPPYRGPMTQ